MKKLLLIPTAIAVIALVVALSVGSSKTPAPLAGVNIGLQDFPEGFTVDGNDVVEGNGFFVGDKGRLTFGETRLAFSSSTSTVASLPLLNGVAKNVFVYDAYVVMTGAPTTTNATNPAFLVGTSSSVFIQTDGTGYDTSCGIVRGCTAATAHDASILNTGSIAGGSASSYYSATNTIFLKQDFQGADTRDGSGTRFIVPVKSTDYLTLYASSSVLTNDTDITGPRRFFDGYAVVKWYTLK